MAILACSAVMQCAVLAETPPIRSVTCEGAYKRHLQGICTNQRDAIFWSWTDVLVKTDLAGKLLRKRAVANHHGDLCYFEGKVYVAVNLGKFNQPPGQEDSWVYVYDAETLDELSRHRVPELVHGAGGIACRDGRFMVVGGLPEDVPENYVYEYDAGFRFVKRHVLNSGHTDMGIQTAAWAHGSWWFGCYGKPPILLRADDTMKCTGRWEFDAALGIEALDQGRCLVGRNTLREGTGYVGHIFVAAVDEKRGLVGRPSEPGKVPDSNPSAPADRVRDILPAAPGGKAWKLVWHDEFEGTKLDTARWSIQEGQRRDGYWSKKAVSLDGKGHLVMSVLKEGDEYLDGCVRTRGKFEHSLGYYVARIRLHKQPGHWPAFWIMGDGVGNIGNDGRDGTEIDIMEKPWLDDRVNYALHWDGYGKDHKSEGKVVEIPGVMDGWHTFGLWWKPDEYVFYVDGKETWRTSAGGVSQVPEFIKLSDEIGKWAGDIKEARLPDAFLVDYVRVYDLVEKE